MERALQFGITAKAVYFAEALSANASCCRLQIFFSVEWVLSKAGRKDLNGETLLLYHLYHSEGYMLICLFEVMN